MEMLEKQTVGAVILINVGWMRKDQVVKKAKSFDECVSAYRVAKSMNEEVKVVMWMQAEEKRVMEIKDELLKFKGVKGLQLKI